MIKELPYMVQSLLCHLLLSPCPQSSSYIWYPEVHLQERQAMQHAAAQGNPSTN